MLDLHRQVETCFSKQSVHTLDSIQKLVGSDKSVNDIKKCLNVLSSSNLIVMEECKCVPMTSEDLKPSSIYVLQVTPNAKGSNSDGRKQQCIETSIITAKQKSANNDNKTQKAQPAHRGFKMPRMIDPSKLTAKVSTQSQPPLSSADANNAFKLRRQLNDLPQKRKLGEISGTGSQQGTSDSSGGSERADNKRAKLTHFDDSANTTPTKQNDLSNVAKSDKSSPSQAQTSMSQKSLESTSPTSTREDSVDQKHPIEDIDNQTRENINELERLTKKWKHAAQLVIRALVNESPNKDVTIPIVALCCSIPLDMLGWDDENGEFVG
ncbi:hypothetical protein RFI_07714 [Reticulomyxa filosa]|uniref:Uncharacterized protein n=1 Tax=Reticulomyxa filosa TaxID=46433 RepID=X6NU06_RETFI|nr:hypothetical protein RFI_07714 [Reticulomyxa filosa]|eukprot:ETO29403.1 hypothetical protein RFI_07714 [Reticulomyxa filosa]